MLQLVPQMIWRSRRTEQLLPVADGHVFHVEDSIPRIHKSDDALGKLHWEGGEFEGVCAHDSASADLALQFPSPMPMGRTVGDRVVLDWHIARREGKFVEGPAVLVIDILQGGNIVSNYIARTLAKKGIHGFVMHMPQNGRRRGDQAHDWSQFLPALRQGVCDARRARDLIAKLPLVNGCIGIQGTSLGGFIATLAASIDNAFDPVLLALTGGDLYSVLSNGKRDAAKVRRRLQEVGFDDAKLREWLWQVEPLRVAHRLDPKRTWLFSARFDQVVPKSSGNKLASAIGLEFSHRRELAGCHYSCVISARRFLSEIIQVINWRMGQARTA